MTTSDILEFHQICPDCGHENTIEATGFGLNDMVNCSHCGHPFGSLTQLAGQADDSNRQAEPEY